MCMYIYIYNIYVCIYIHTHVTVCVYIYNLFSHIYSGILLSHKKCNLGTIWINPEGIMLSEII